MNAPLYSNTSLFISHFEHGHFTLAQTIESLNISEALNILSSGWMFVKSKYQFQALNSSSSVKAAFNSIFHGTAFQRPSHGVSGPNTTFHPCDSHIQIPGSARKGCVQSAVVLLEPVYKIEVGQALSVRQVVLPSRSGNVAVWIARNRDLGTCKTAGHCCGFATAQNGAWSWFEYGSPQTSVQPPTLALKTHSQPHSYWLPSKLFTAAWMLTRIMQMTSGKHTRQQLVFQFRFWKTTPPYNQIQWASVNRSIHL